MPGLWRGDRFLYLRRTSLTLDASPMKGSGLRGLISLWEKVARVCDGKDDVVKAYDLKNEPPEDNEVWLEWAQKCLDAIRAIDSATPILVEAATLANPSGFAALRPLKGRNLAYGVHVYYPHGFTHGRIFGENDFGSPEASPARFYPGWITPIDWTRRRETWFDGSER